MRVLFLNSIAKNKWGGGEKWMLNAANGLQKKGNDVFVGCHPNSIIQKNAISESLTTIDLAFSSDFDVFGFFKLLRIIKKHQINIIICGQNKDTKIASIAATFNDEVKVFARHGLRLISKNFKYKIFFSKMIHGIITNTNSIKEEYMQYGWFKEGFIEVIYNGFTPPQKIEAIDLIKEFSLPKDSITIFSAGRLAKQKGFEILISAAKIAYTNKKNWIFLIAGQGKKQKKLLNQIKNQGLEEKVFLIGFKKNVLPYIYSSDLFVLSSYYEGMPNVVMEAMGIGKCCVVTSVNGNNELITNGKDGILVRPGNSQDLYLSIEKIINDQYLRDTLGYMAKKRISDNFSEEKMINELERFLKEKSH